MIAILSQATYNAIKPIVLPSLVVIGTAIVSVDGRCAICHGFTDEDIAYLVGKGATMYEVMPTDFVIKADDEE